MGRRAERGGGRSPALGLCLILTLFAAGCGNDPYPAGETARPILYRSIADDPKTLDPAVVYNIDDGAIVTLLYDSYFDYDYLKRNPFVLNLTLGAAPPKREPYAGVVREKGKAVRRAGEAWTFRIKRGLHFQDDPCFPGGRGREIRAADFVYSFRRMADPSVACPVLGYVEDKIVGFPAYEALNRSRRKRGLPADYAAPVAGLQLDERDPYTFRVILNQPYPQLRYLMAMTFTAPMAHEAVERYGAELARHPVGCGPYVLSEYLPRQRIVLTANPRRPMETYPRSGGPGDREAGMLADAGRRLPLTEKIVFTTIREGITGWNLFLQGYQDAWSVSQTNFQQVMSRQGALSPDMVRKGVRLYKDVSPNLYYFGFNMKDPVVGGYSPRKRKLRQAISLAIDSHAFIDLFSQGMGQPAEFLIPPGIAGYDPAYRDPNRRYSVERAKRLLAEAGYPGGVDPKTGERLTIFYDNMGTDAAGRQQVGLATKEFEAIGINLQSRSWRDNVWQDRVDKGQFQLIHYGWLADYPDPENFLLLLYGPNVRPGPNDTAYDNPEFNRLFERMRGMEDGPGRLALIRRMRAIAVEDCPMVFVNHDITLSIGHRWLRNVKPHPVAIDTLKYRAVDGSERARLQAEWNRPNYGPAAGAAVLLILGSLPAAGTVRRRRRRRARRGGAGGESEAAPEGASA